MQEIEEELALILYCHDKKEITYAQVIDWVGQRYKDHSIFQAIMNESTCIADVINLLRQKYSLISLGESVLLSKIAAEYFEEELSIIEAVSATYDLLNIEGEGKHELSSTLYRLVDDFPNESRREYSVRAKNSDFSLLLKKYDSGEYEKIYKRVFKT